MHRFSGLIGCILFLFVTGSLSAQTLIDQLGNSMDIGAEIAIGNLILVWSDSRDAPADITAWRKTLEPLIPAGTRIFMVADLKAIPFFVSKTAVAKGVVNVEPKRPIMLDWKGEIIARLGFEKGGSVVLVLGSGGAVKARVKGASTPAGIATIVAALR